MVSVLMCTYNRRFCLKQAIDSVLCQTYPDFEFVIVDDGSTDGTEELIKSYQDPRIRYFKLNRNSFYCYAANQGLDHCQGDYVAFMNSDDAVSYTHLDVYKRQVLSELGALSFRWKRGRFVDCRDSGRIHKEG